MERPLISIIVPMYGVEQYIKRCVNSILSQSYTNLEIILVDDGSPDKCGVIADEYAKEDNRIVVIHKQNGGLSDARNVAIPLAKGEYINFIDSDDWVSKYYIENLYNAILKDNSDLSISWFKEVEEKKEKALICDSLLSYEIIDSKECLKRLLYQDYIETTACGKLYKKSLFEDLRYPTGRLYEDIPVTYEYINRANKIATIRNQDYYYYQRKTSIQHQKFNINKMDAIKHIKNMVNDVLGKYPDLKSPCYCRLFSVECNILFQISGSEYKDLKKKLWNHIKKMRLYILRDKNARKKARFASIISYGGYRFMRLIYSLIKANA